MNDSQETNLTKTSARCAIYLYGHGPRREPRLIEMQHRTILRAIPWLREKWTADQWGRFEIGEVFVDLNFPPSQSADCPPSLYRLLQEIRATKYSHVVLNIESGSFPAEQHSWIEQYLAAAGATVCNIAYETGPLIAHLAQRYDKALAERATAWANGTDDAAEILALFPGVVASVVGAIFDDWDLRDDTSLTRLKPIIEGIGKENPYQQTLCTLVDCSTRS